MNPLEKKYYFCQAKDYSASNSKYPLDLTYYINNSASTPFSRLTRSCFYIYITTNKEPFSFLPIIVKPIEIIFIPHLVFIYKINQKKKETSKSTYFSSLAHNSVNLVCGLYIVLAVFCPRHHNLMDLPNAKTP